MQEYTAIASAMPTAGYAYAVIVVESVLMAVHLLVTLTYNFLANHLDKSCLKWDESALPF
ncbi:hypothetical protein [Nostoc sp.]|uniref:hypothetical protein n=1 Tax=Nostoc sp. TaxID=1180 RepID=UPI002FFAA1D8